ncbi:MAG: RNA polymerase sigma factor [Clostridia bacterium]|nr:RNA polymerase sigma factor [Clostridia bacterium]
MLEFLLLMCDESERDRVKRLYKSYHKYMVRYTVSKFKNMGRRNCFYDAQDTVQNTFMKITRYVHNIDFSRGEKSIKNYLFAILENEICNFLNESAEFEEAEEAFSEETAYDFFEEMDMRERRYEVVKAMETLDERYGSTLHLFYYEELSPNKIAILMGLPAKTVYTRLARGKTHLQNLLKEVVIYD